MISKISSAIWSNISRNFRINVSEGSKENTAIPKGHAEQSNPVVSLDQTGINQGTNINVNPAISVDQSGTETRKRSSDELTVTHSEVPVYKRSRMCASIDSEADVQENLNNDILEDEIVSPNSRWEASEELTQFLGTASKHLNKFERRSLVNAYPRPNVDDIYTPSLDEYLKPFIQGVSAPDRGTTRQRPRYFWTYVYNLREPVIHAQLS